MADPGAGGGVWPLVGRAHDLDRLEAAVVGGRGVTLTGEAGVGKSRLARALLERLAAGGWTTWTFEAGPAAAAVPFLPFACLVRAPVTDGLDRIVEATTTLVGSGERVVALVDDVHALDDVSLAFVAHVVSTTGVRLVLTARPSDDASRRIRAWRDVLPGVGVEPIDRAAVDELVRGALGATEPGALRWIWETTRGNPLFVRELLIDAVERGALAEHAGRWALAPSARAPGRRLTEVVSDRFGSLWDAEREAVELLAVAAPIGLRLFEKLTSPEVVQELEHRGLITTDRSDRRVNVRLTHRIHEEVVRDRLGQSTIDFHRRRVLDAMNSIGERRGSDRLRAALWRVELGDATDPASLVTAAGDLIGLTGFSGPSGRRTRGEIGASSGAELLGQAARLGRAALDAGGGIPAAFVLISALSRLGRHDEALEVRASLGDLMADEADSMLVARLLTDVDALVRGDPAQADARLRGLEMIVTSPSLLRSLRSFRVTSLLAAGFPARARELATAILDDPDATEVERSRAVTGSASALGYAGRTTEAMSLADEAAAAAAASQDSARMVGAVFPRIIALASAGRFRELDKILRFCHTMSSDGGFDDGVAVFSGALGNAALLAGRPRSALRWADAALEHAGDVDPMGVRSVVHAVRAQALALLGDVDGASAALAELDVDRTSAFELEANRARAWVAVAAGRAADAVEQLVAHAEVSADRGYLCGAVAQLHDVARIGDASLVARRISELAADMESALVAVQVDRVVALADEDADALEDVAARFVDVGATLDAAESWAQVAALHRRAGRQGRASAAAARSKDLAGRCEGAQTPALASAEPLAALTKREREMVLLAADGLSNREIADRLVVSVRTVHTHLYNAYAKLGVESREELSAAIARY